MQVRFIAARVILAACLFSSGCQTPLPGLPVLRRAPASPLELQQRVEALVHQVDPHLRLGVKVVEASSGRGLVEINSEQRFVPASTMKVLAAATALHTLGPAHRFETALFTDQGPNAQGDIGHLYVVGSGDPGLGVGDLAALIFELRQLGVRRIAGDLIADTSAFDAVHWGQGWAWDDRAEDYSAPVGGLNLLGNTLEISVSPGAGPGAPALVTAYPPGSYAVVVNDLMTVHSEDPGRVCIQTDQAADKTGLLLGQSIRVSGTVRANEKPQVYRYAVSDGGVFVAATLRDLLRAGAVEFSGQVLQGSLPDKVSRLATHQSLPLSAQLIDFMKKSDNHGIECLIKKIGLTSDMRQGTWQAGLETTRSFLAQDMGLEAAAFAMVDGSGLSRENLLSSSQLVKVLLNMYGDATLGPSFIATLPLGGVDGTLAERFLDSPLRGRVRAKTGSMGGVSTLAGYLELENHESVAFSIMMNGFVGPLGVYRKLQEDILNILWAGL